MNIYALLTWSDGVFTLRSEHSTKESGIVAYDNLHAALINDTEVAECSIRLVDSQFNIVDNKYFDIIRHAQPTPEPTEE